MSYCFKQTRKKTNCKVTSKASARLVTFVLFFFWLGYVASSETFSDDYLSGKGENVTHLCLDAIIPHEIKGVSLGITLKQLLALRPNIKLDDFPYAFRYFEEVPDHLFFRGYHICCQEIGSGLSLLVVLGHQRL